MMIFLVVVVTLFGGLRWNTGTDWDNYFVFFKDVKFSQIFHYTRRVNDVDKMEPLYCFLNASIRTLFGKYYIFNLLEVFFIQFSYYKFSTYHLPKAPLLCYCFIMVISPGYFPVRQTLAIAVLMWGYRYVKERNLKAFLLIVFTAFFIHQVAIAGLLLYWIGKVHIKDLYIVIIFLLLFYVGYALQDYFVMLSVMIGGSVGEKALHYTEFETVEKEALPIMTLMVNAGFLFFYLYFRKKFNFTRDDWYNTLLNSYLLFIGILFTFSNGMSDLNRVMAVFTPGHFILFTSIVSYSYNTERPLFSYNRKVFPDKNTMELKAVRLFICLFFLFYYIYRIPQNFAGYFFEECCVPYRTIFDYPGVW